MSSNKSLTDIICLFSSNNFKENNSKYLSYSRWHDIEKNPENSYKSNNVYPNINESKKISENNCFKQFRI